MAFSFNDLYGKKELPKQQQMGGLGNKLYQYNQRMIYEENEKMEMLQRFMGRERTAPTAPPAEEPVGSNPPAPAIAGEELNEYEQLAKEIGFAPPHLDVERFKAHLAELGLRVYDRAKVKAYLDQEWGKATSTFSGTRVPWCWRPMREADRRNNAFSLMDTDQVMPGLAAYDKAVPMPVLMTVKNILEKFPDAKFYICDLVREHEQPQNKDPFLMVEVGSESFIVERWDEPKYRE